MDIEIRGKGYNMDYYVSEVQVDEGVKLTAGIKARDDIEQILSDAGYQAICVETANINQKKKNIYLKLNAYRTIAKEWEEKLSVLKRGNSVLIQFPVINHSIFLASAIKKVQKRGVKVVAVIHDLEMLRSALKKENSASKKLRIKLEELSLLEKCDKIIVHNVRMKDKLLEFGLEDSKLCPLEIFDYLIPDFEAQYCQDHFGKEKPIIIAGALRKHKAGYAYDLPSGMEYNLYGVGYTGEKRENVHYMGAFPPEKLPFCLEGSFGLVWDGESCETCSGIYGEYLKINNPHKTSLYLASGVPVIIWEKAALAEFVQKNHCGITVVSLEEIGQKLEKMSEEDYQMIKKSAENVGKRLRNGYYTFTALK